MIFVTKKYRLLYRVFYVEATRKQYYNPKEYRLLKYRICHTRIGIRKGWTTIAPDSTFVSDLQLARRDIIRWEQLVALGWHHREYIAC